MITKRPKDTRTTLPLGPWKGVRDLGDAGMQSPEYLQDAINCHFPDAQGGGSGWARPGCTRQGTPVSGEVLLLHSHETNDETFYTFALSSGKVWRQATATTWTDVTPAGPFPEAVFHCRAINYNGEVIFTQETLSTSTSYRPWRATNLGSTPVTRTAIDIDGLGGDWRARNAPTIYGSKLFFILRSLAATRYNSRIVWSEEQDAATGYVQSGYANYWDVIPSSTERINAIVGTNAALYYFRRYSIGAIYGAVNSTFSTSSTTDYVSQEIGTLPNCQPIVAKGFIWFLNTDGLPHRFRIGSSEIEPVWGQMRQRITKIKSTSLDTNGYLLDYPYLVYLRDLNKVAILFLRDSSASGDAARNIYIFDADTGNYEGRWMIELATQPSSETSTAAQIGVIADIPRSTAHGSFVGASALMASGTLPGGVTLGNVYGQYLHKQQTFGDNSAAMHMSVTGQLTPNEENVEARIDQIAVETVPDTATTLSLDHYTPRVATTGVALSATNSSTDVISSSYDRGIRRAGLNALARWWRYVLWWNVPSGTTQYVIERASVKVRPQPAGVASP